MRCPPALRRVSCGRMIQHVAQKLSRLPTTDGKETSYGNGSLLLREVRLEGLDKIALRQRLVKLIGFKTSKWPREKEGGNQVVTPSCTLPEFLERKKVRS